MGIAEISDLAGLLHHTDEFGVGVFGISHPAMKIEDVLVGQLCFEIEAFVSGRRAVGCRDHDLCGRSAGDRREEAGGYLDVVVEPVESAQIGAKLEIAVKAYCALDAHFDVVECIWIVFFQTRHVLKPSGAVAL
jgi:hypothetical protein